MISRTLSFPFPWSLLQPPVISGHFAALLLSLAVRRDWSTNALVTILFGLYMYA